MKFEPSYKYGFLVGYSAGNGYRIFIPSENQIIISRDVDLIEGQKLAMSSLNNLRNDMEVSGNELILNDEGINSDTSEDREINNNNYRCIGEPSTGNEEINFEELTYYPGARRSTRPSNPPDRYTSLISFYSLMSHDIHQSYNEAINGPNSQNGRMQFIQNRHPYKEKSTW